MLRMPAEPGFSNDGQRIPYGARFETALRPPRHEVVRAWRHHRATLIGAPAWTAPHHLSCRFVHNAAQRGDHQSASSRPSEPDTAVTNMPHEMSTATTGQVQCLSSASEVSSKVE